MSKLTTSYNREISGPYKGEMLAPYEGLYLDWVNDFLTVEGFASHHGIPVQEARHIIVKGRANHQDKFGHH